MRKSMNCWKLSALFILLAGTSLTAGVVFQVETTYHSGSSSRGPESSKMSVEGKNLKMEIQSGRGGSNQVPDEVVFRRRRRVRFKFLRAGVATR